MFGSQILEIALGLALTYALLALLATGMVEFVAANLRLRGKTLVRGIRTMLNDLDGVSGDEGERLADKVLDHPLIRGLGYKRTKEEEARIAKMTAAPQKAIDSTIGKMMGRKPTERSGEPKSKPPSYIPSKHFAIALLDVVADTDGKTTIAIDDLRTKVEALPNADVRRTLLNLIDTADGKIDQVRTNVEDWFDSTMDRVSGWYKRNAQWMTLAAAAIVTLLFNADTTALATHLSTDQAKSEAIAAVATNVTPDEYAGATGTLIADKIDELQLPLGWYRSNEIVLPHGAWDWVNKIIGLLITIGAVSLGAPFWFDAIGAIVKLRSSGIIPKRAGQTETNKA